MHLQNADLQVLRFDILARCRGTLPVPFALQTREQHLGCAGFVASINI